MSKIKLDRHNYRLHDDKNKQLIKKSVDELGAGRSILIDSDNEIIAGNGVFEQWGDRPVKVVETDGSELIVVKRNDLKTDDEKRKKLAILDNSTSDLSTFDFKLLKTDFDVQEIEDLGIEINAGFFEKFEASAKKAIEKIPYPITIVVDETDYEIWQKVKNKMNETNDLKAFMKIFKTLKDE
jgi:hypothetical protein